MSHQLSQGPVLHTNQAYSPHSHLSIGMSCLLLKLVVKQETSSSVGKDPKGLDCNLQYIVQRETAS